MVYPMAIVTNSDVAGKIRGAAAERRVTHAKIAEALSVSPMAISRRMNGDTPYTPEELIKVGKLLSVPVGVFFGEVTA